MKKLKPFLFKWGYVIILALFGLIFSIILVSNDFFLMSFKEDDCVVLFPDNTEHYYGCRVQTMSIAAYYELLHHKENGKFLKKNDELYKFIIEKQKAKKIEDMFLLKQEDIKDFEFLTVSQNSFLIVNLKSHNFCLEPISKYPKLFSVLFVDTDYIKKNVELICHFIISLLPFSHNKKSIIENNTAYDPTRLLTPVELEYIKTQAEKQNIKLFRQTWQELPFRFSFPWQLPEKGYDTQLHLYCLSYTCCLIEFYGKFYEVEPPVKDNLTIKSEYKEFKEITKHLNFSW